jgi:tRNA dimethylallyltransferase
MPTSNSAVHRSRAAFTAFDPRLLENLPEMHLPPDVLTRCWILAGPTAVGKSAVALELAELLDAEIVALDSMTVYRGMDIGTAKPSLQDQSRVPHHLLNVIEPHEEYSLAEYLTASAKACAEIVARGRIPLFVGGTGLYLRGILRGLFEGPAADWSLRQKLEDLQAAEGPEALHRKLQKVDPDSARRLHPNDQRRVIRALEVFELTGVPLSVQQQQATLPVDQRPRHVFWLEPPRDWLHDRIDRRVVEMFATGLVAEVQHLRELPLGLGRTARQALGYKEVLDHLDQQAGLQTLDETMMTLQTRTRQFAKRQHTWFRNLPECHAVPITGNESPRAIAVLLASSPDQDSVPLGGDCHRID